MRFENVYIPYGGYWSTPFCKWQGSLSSVHSVSLAAQAARKAMAARDIPASALDSLVLGMTVPQKSTLYGAPWLAALIGNDGITGTTVAQACATGARSLATAGGEVDASEASDNHTVLAVTTDRCSNGPHIYYPNPFGPGGTGEKEDWVMDSFGNDPWARNAMIQTAENVAAEEQDQIARNRTQATVVRLRAISRTRWPTMRGLPASVSCCGPSRRGTTSGRKVVATLAMSDEGVFRTTDVRRPGQAASPDDARTARVTFGSQTHPADGNAGILVSTTRTRPRLPFRATATSRCSCCPTVEARTQEGLHGQGDGAGRARRSRKRGRHPGRRST